MRLWHDTHGRKRLGGASARLALMLCVPTLAAADPPELGDTSWALPGIARVGVVAAGAPRLSAAGHAGYGYTESQVPGVLAHHRIGGALAAGYAPISELELALRLDGRYDWHPSDQDTDKGLVGDPRLLVRGGTVVAGQFHLGGDLGVWTPGNDAPSFVMRATTLDARLLAAWVARRGDILVGTALGFRYGNSARSAQEPARYSAADRVALGLSAFNAALVGLGAGYLVGKTELLAEGTADLLVGAGAPSRTRSPIRVTLGPRYHLSERLALELLGDATLGKRPGSGPDDSLAPIEPRLSIMAGLRFRETFAEAAVVTASPPVFAQPTRAPVEQTAPPTQAPRTTTVAGVVTDSAGTPVAGATVALEIGGHVSETTSGEDGKFQIEGVPDREGRLTVTAPGFKVASQRLSPDADLDKLSTQLEADLPAAQIRGMVRSFGGKALRAQVTVDPPGVTVQTDEEGYFQVDVEPGTHTVTIGAEGYVEQRRSLKVEESGVFVVNADLTRQAR